MAKVWINGETWVEVEHAEGVNVVSFTVDDKEIAVSGGQTILEAVARMPGIGNIPALCYHPAVKPYGACRICTVEVSEDGGSKFKFVAACLYPVKEGLVVKTDTERVRKLRKGIIELLLARCPNVKRIQELAYCPGKQDECLEALIRVFEKIPDLPEIKRIIDAESELKNVTNKLIRSLEDTRLMGLIPGRCRICSRISL